MHNILPISWTDAPDDPAGEALYRVNQLENCFIHHYEKTKMRDELLFLIFRELIKDNLITQKHVSNAIDTLETLYPASQDLETMEAGYLCDIKQDFVDFLAPDADK